MSGADPDERTRVGLCAACAQARRLVSPKGSVFFRCGRAAEDPDFRDYPPLPVRACAGFVEAESRPAADPD